MMSIYISFFRYICLVLTWHVVRGGRNLTIVGSMFYLHTDNIACEYCILERFSGG